jgi:hypothetical protein
MKCIVRPLEVAIIFVSFSGFGIFVDIGDNDQVVRVGIDQATFDRVALESLPLPYRELVGGVGDNMNYLVHERRKAFAVFRKK